MIDDPSVKFGEFVLKLLVEAHKQGGIALAALSVCMVFAFMLANTANTIAAYSLLAVGAQCILAVITIIYYLVICQHSAVNRRDRAIVDHLRDRRPVLVVQSR